MSGAGKRSLDGRGGSPLPSNRAFVVQFAEGRARNGLTGRVEHLASGRTARFTSWAQLQAFLRGRLESLEEGDCR